ncbi:hypothetical protein NDU88_006084 [Pleurodeles waltl]|uniref:Uncharacterized protein n=1 Tax=Pleurodeles waltl TaxID=8319 RepID=A0AAV7MD28_PLEWA|nr:hypothetical protein NDU88_006084 [Pleurodeles waltl]
MLQKQPVGGERKGETRGGLGPLRSPSLLGPTALLPTRSHADPTLCDQCRGRLEPKDQAEGWRCRLQHQTRVGRRMSGSGRAAGLAGPRNALLTPTSCGDKPQRYHEDLIVSRRGLVGPLGDKGPAALSAE